MSVAARSGTTSALRSQESPLLGRDGSAAREISSRVANGKPYTRPTDWVFASEKTHGRTPRVGDMLCVDYLRPAAIQAGVKLEKGPAVRIPQPAPRFGVVPGYEQEDRCQTGQRSMCYAKSAIMLDHYAQTDMDELIAASGDGRQLEFPTGKND